MNPLIQEKVTIGNTFMIGQFLANQFSFNTLRTNIAM